VLLQVKRWRSEEHGQVMITRVTKVRAIGGESCHMKSIYAALLLLATPAMANEALQAAITECEAKGLGTRTFCTRIITKLGEVGAALGRDGKTACQRTPNGFSSYEVCIKNQMLAAQNIVGALMGDLFINEHRKQISACMHGASSPVNARDCMVEKMPDYMARMKTAP